MIRISNTSSIEIPELEKDNTFKLNAIWIEYGMNGILPRIQFDLEVFSKELDFFNFTVKIIFNGIKFVDSPAVVESFSRESTRCTISAYLVKDLEFVRGRSTHTYNSIKDLVNSTWSGNIEIEIPNQTDLYLCQMNELNHVFLTKGLICSSAEQSFYYDLFNSIKPVQLTARNVDHDLTKDKSNVAITIKDRDITVSKNQYNFIEEFTDEISFKSLTVAGDKAYFGDDKHIQLEENGIRTQLAFNRSNANFVIEYQNDLDIKVGDILKLRLTKTVNINCMVISSKIRIDNSSMKIVSRCIDYDT